MLIINNNSGDMEVLLFSNIVYTNKYWTLFVTNVIFFIISIIMILTIFAHIHYTHTTTYYLLATKG